MKPNIRFEEIVTKKKTKVFIVFSNHSDERLATIFFYPQWRKYVHGDIPSNIIFSSECDRELADFKENLTKEWRESLKLKKTIVTEHNMNDVVFTKEELIKKIENNKNKIIILDEYYILDDDNEKQKNRMSEEMAERFESLNNNRRVI